MEDVLVVCTAHGFLCQCLFQSHCGKREGKWGENENEYAGSSTECEWLKITLVYEVDGRINLRRRKEREKIKSSNAFRINRLIISHDQNKICRSCCCDCCLVNFSIYIRMRYNSLHLVSSTSQYRHLPKRAMFSCSVWKRQKVHFPVNGPIILSHS